MSRSHRAKKRKNSSSSQSRAKRRKTKAPSVKLQASISAKNLSIDDSQANTSSSDPKLIYTRPRKDTGYQSHDDLSSGTEELDQDT